MRLMCENCESEFHVGDRVAPSSVSNGYRSYVGTVTEVISDDVVRVVNEHGCHFLVQTKHLRVKHA